MKTIADFATRELVVGEEIRLESVKGFTFSPGFPLDPGVRSLMEKRFNRPFGRVRVHSDETASESARLLNAKAYTIGSHIVFAEGHYDPKTQAGQWLLAHELAHVVQQSQHPEPPTSPAKIRRQELERAADLAADIVSSGYAVPLDFSFGIAQAGIPQFHIVPGNPEHQPCPGIEVNSDAATGRLAHRVLEFHYTTTEGLESARNNAIFFGTGWVNNPQVPAGVPNQPFARALLDAMMRLPVEDRPNIIDFHLRDAYFFARASPISASRAIRIINRFHATVNNLEKRFNEGDWNSANSYWWPNHALQMTLNSYGHFVCTQATDHAPPRGLILYDIRTRVRQRRSRQHATSYELFTADDVMAEFFPSLKAGLPEAVKHFDPDDRNFVFIVPADFYYNYYNQKRANKVWEFHKIQPSYNFPGGQEVKKLRDLMHQVSLIIGVVGAAAVVVVGSVAIVASLPAATIGAGAAASTGATAGAGAATSTGLAAGAGAATGASTPISTIIVSTDIAAKVAASGTAAAAGGGSFTAALWAVASAPAAKAIGAAAGVSLIIGSNRNAYAGTPSGQVGKRTFSHGTPELLDVSAFRAVAITDFKPHPAGSIQEAYSWGSPQDFVHSPETAKGKFDVGTKVLFDGIPHIVIGGFSAS